MNTAEARKILGLRPDESPDAHLEEFQKARERIAEMVRAAPNQTLEDRYRAGLVEFDEALAAIKAAGNPAPALKPRRLPRGKSQENPAPESAGTPKSAEIFPSAPLLSLSPEKTPATIVAAEIPDKQSTENAGEKPSVEPKEAPVIDLPELVPPRRKNRLATAFVWFFILLLAGAGSGYYYLRHKQERETKTRMQITRLDKIGTAHVQSRRWQEAAEAFAEIRRLDAKSETARIGEAAIRAGMEEEQTQFIGYWNGQALAELDAGRLEEAEKAIRMVTARFSDQPETKEIAAKISVARSRQARSENLAKLMVHLQSREWETAAGIARKMAEGDPEDTQAQELLKEAEAGIAKQVADKKRAAELFASAKELDQGTFDQQAVDWLREALALTPEHAEAKALLEKFSSYTKTLRVPGDFPTPEKAVAVARGSDRIVIGEISWQGTLVVNSPLVIEGAGPEKTIVSADPAAGSAISFGPGAKGARVSGISFAHTRMLTEPGERFSTALVRSGGVLFSNCRFKDSSGHGLVVIDGGKAEANRCQFDGNTWNGAAAIGKNSTLEVRDSEATGNFENGFEAWSGAGAVILNTRCHDNSRNGIHLDPQSADIRIEGNRLTANREFGIVITSGTKGIIANNHVGGNLLGGIVVRKAAGAVQVRENEALKNHGPGIVLDRSLRSADYASNRANGNTPEEVSTVDLSQ